MPRTKKKPPDDYPLAGTAAERGYVTEAELPTLPDLADLDAFAARVVGDSMEPKYSEGDVIVFSPERMAHDGDDCFVRFADGRSTFRRATFPTRNSVKLSPINERYKGRTVAMAEVEQIAPAVYRMQRLVE